MKFKLVPVKKVLKKKYKGNVYDLTVKDNHSYNIDGIIVHNSVCSTRIMTGCGVPQLKAIYDCAYAVDIPIIADGGIRNSGDIVKALVFGADVVMIGRLFSGTEQTPGKIKFIDNKMYKEYRGSASMECKIANKLENNNIEGISTMVEYKGDLEGIINKLLDGIRSGMSYIGAKDIVEMRDAKYNVVTVSGKKEADPHIYPM
jgi:IMP dehydrogenase